MTEIAFSSSFKRAFKKRIKGNARLEEVFWLRVETFKVNPFAKKLHTHKLSGKMKELWSFRIDYDTRIVFFFVEGFDKAVFIDIGGHEEVY